MKAKRKKIPVERGNSSSSLAGGESPEKLDSKFIFLGLVLVAATLIIYWQVGGHEFINFDDNLYVTANPHVVKGITVANIIWA